MTQSPNPAHARDGGRRPGDSGAHSRDAGRPLLSGAAYGTTATEDTAVTGPARNLGAARQAPPYSAPTGPVNPPPPTTGGRTARTRAPRRARLQLRHVNPWTVLKFSCVLAVALFFVWMIVIGVLFGILDATGVIGKINDAVTTINGDGSTAPLTPGVVFGSAAIIGAINIVLFIALATVGSVVYNLCADLVGGVELTLSERGD